MKDRSSTKKRRELKKNEKQRHAAFRWLRHETGAAKRSRDIREALFSIREETGNPFFCENSFAAQPQRTWRKAVMTSIEQIS
jgi:hypothetical protein